MGATVALLVAGKRPDLVKGLVLADPVIMPRVYYFWKHVFPPVTWIANRNMLARGAKKRRAEFPAFREALDSYSGRGGVHDLARAFPGRLSARRDRPGRSQWRPE
jgi:pimeloyl-ACP methyl ester carboxylesterase